MGGTRILPVFQSQQEWHEYELISKRTLWAVAYDYALLSAGGDEATPEQALEELLRRIEIIRASGLDDGTKYTA